MTIRTPARFPFPEARDVADNLLHRVRGGKLGASLEILKRSGEKSWTTGRKGGALWLLDERGDRWTSEEWSKRLLELADGGGRQLCLWIGGAYGAPQEIQDIAVRTISLGPCTLPSWLACLNLAEQLYRADTIIRGTPYHHG